MKYKYKETIRQEKMCAMIRTRGVVRTRRFLLC